MKNVFGCVYNLTISARCTLAALQVIAILLLSFMTSTSIASTPRTVDDALRMWQEKILADYGLADLKVEFITVSYAGLNRQFDGLFRNGATIIRARIEPDGELTLSQREESRQQRVVSWQKAADISGLPDLDSLVRRAEERIRSDGYTPTGIVLLKFTQKQGGQVNLAESLETKVFFEIHESKKARVVEFVSDQLMAHKEGTLLKVTLPVVRVPQVQLPQGELVEVEIPGLDIDGIRPFQESDGSMTLRIMADFLFDFDEDQPKASSEEAIKQLAKYLLKVKPKVISIEGHTDSWGTPQYNDDLSLRRAIAIRKRLKALGVVADDFSVKGHGELNPIARETNEDGSDDPTGRQRNRRVEVKYR